jgi:hypothetical protein
LCTVQGRGSGEDESKGRRRVRVLVPVYGARCQSKTPLPNTFAARTVGAGLVTDLIDERWCTGSSCSVIPSAAECIRIRRMGYCLIRL